jgi:hypothetical protein
MFIVSIAVSSVFLTIRNSCVLSLSTHSNAFDDESILPMERGSGGWLSRVFIGDHPSNPLLLRVYFSTIRRTHSSQGKFRDWFREFFTLADCST